MFVIGREVTAADLRARVPGVPRLYLNAWIQSMLIRIFALIKLCPPPSFGPSLLH